MIYFNPRLSCERRPYTPSSTSYSHISIHASRVRGDAHLTERRTVWLISIHASRVRGDGVDDETKKLIVISIHASRVRGDSLLTFKELQAKNFNPRLSCERRQYNFMEVVTMTKFQSTPLVWEATTQYADYLNDTFISIHASRVRGDKTAESMADVETISIHASRVRGDIYNLQSDQDNINFNPRLSCERRPTAFSALLATFWISIHASRVRGDYMIFWRTLDSMNFNPRLSCERRRL